MIHLKCIILILLLFTKFNFLKTIFCTHLKKEKIWNKLPFAPLPWYILNDYFWKHKGKIHIYLMVKTQHSVNLSRVWNVGFRVWIWTGGASTSPSKAKDAMARYMAQRPTPYDGAHWNGLCFLSTSSLRIKIPTHMCKQSHVVISAKVWKVHETPQYRKTLAHLFTHWRISTGTFDMVGRAHIQYVAPRGQHFHDTWPVAAANRCPGWMYFSQGGWKTLEHFHSPLYISHRSDVNFFISMYLGI